MPCALGCFSSFPSIGQRCAFTRELVFVSNLLGRPCDYGLHTIHQSEKHLGDLERRNFYQLRLCYSLEEQRHLRSNWTDTYDMGAPTNEAALHTPAVVIIFFPSHVAIPPSPVLRPLDTASQTFFFLTCVEDSGSPDKPSM